MRPTRITKESATIIDNIFTNELHLLKKKKQSSTRSSYPTEFMKNGAIISGNMNIAEHFNSFFANIGPTLD